MRLTITALCLTLLSAQAVANPIPIVNVIISYPHETSTVVVNQCISFIRMRGGVVWRIYDDIRSFAVTAELTLVNEVSAAETMHSIMIKPGKPPGEWHRS